MPVINQHAVLNGRLTLTGVSTQNRIVSEMASRVENRRSGFSLPVTIDCAFAPSPQSGLAWLCFLFLLIEPDMQISRILLSERHTPNEFGM